VNEYTKQESYEAQPRLQACGVGAGVVWNLAAPGVS